MQQGGGPGSLTTHTHTHAQAAVTCRPPRRPLAPRMNALSQPRRYTTLHARRNLCMRHVRPACAFRPSCGLGLPHDLSRLLGSGLAEQAPTARVCAHCLVALLVLECSVNLTLLGWTCGSAVRGRVDSRPQAAPPRVGMYAPTPQLQLTSWCNQGFSRGLFELKLKQKAVYRRLLLPPWSP